MKFDLDEIERSKAKCEDFISSIYRIFGFKCEVFSSAVPKDSRMKKMIDFNKHIPEDIFVNPRIIAPQKFNEIIRELIDADDKFPHFRDEFLKLFWQRTVVISKIAQWNREKEKIEILKNRYKK